MNYFKKSQFKLFYYVITTFLLFTNISICQEKDILRATEAINVVGQYIDMFKPSAEELQRRQNAATAAENQKIAEENKMKEREGIAERAFKRDVLDKYLDQANKGNESYRIGIVYDLYKETQSYCYCYLGYLIPNWENWMQEAIKNNRYEATGLIGYNALYWRTGNNNRFNLNLSTSQGLKILEDAASTIENGGRLLIQLKENTAKNKKTKEVSITFIDESGAASKAGLKLGDVILKIDDIVIDSSEKCYNTIFSHKAGDNITIKYSSGGKILTTTAILDKQPQSKSKVDIMIMLAEYYNRKTEYNGGGNTEKALYWYTKAAENNSPNAMYALGKIYSYSKVDSYYGEKYKIKKDYTTAFNWFNKSLNTDIKPGYIMEHLKIGSHFEVNSYDELIKMYQKGNGCEKSASKANEIIAIKEDYLLKQKLNSK